MHNMARWKQYDLLEGRDKYGVNDVHLGLTGLLQISLRDELEISFKAQLASQYM